MLIDGPKLNAMRKSLFHVYRESKPSTSDTFWSVGQLCVVRYHADNSWYRGKVVEVSITIDITRIVTEGFSHFILLKQLRRNSKCRNKNFKTCFFKYSKFSEWCLTVFFI